MEENKELKNRKLKFKSNPKRLNNYKEFYDIIKHKVILAMITHLNLPKDKVSESNLINTEITKEKAIELINQENWSGLIPESLDDYTGEIYQWIKPKITQEYDNMEYFQAIIEYKPGDDTLKIFALDLPDSIIVNIVKGLMDWYMHTMKNPIN